MQTHKRPRGELRFRDLRMVGPEIEVEESDDVTVRVTVDGEEIASQGAEGVYGLLWIPADTRTLGR